MNVKLTEVVSDVSGLTSEALTGWTFDATGKQIKHNP
jgi:hypothetical protein